VVRATLGNPLVDDCCHDTSRVASGIGRIGRNEQYMMSLAKSLNCDGRNGRTLLLIAVALLLLGLPHEWTRTHLAYERTALLHGELWRAVSAHFVHLDLQHAALNVVGFALVWALYRGLWSGGQWCLFAGIGMLAIDTGLWFLQPGVQWYVGASGVLHALLVAGLVAQLRTERGIAILVGVLLLAKLAWEARHGALPFAGEGHDVVLPAHRYGAVGGLLAALTLTLRRKWL
jgi:rhomboid family GlyGly-CTERM serine protease